ncbi:glycoside hydrolase [Trametopsis cervina]|nr:glycoside hydrolase [Trametopsis cervina]
MRAIKQHLDDPARWQWKEHTPGQPLDTVSDHLCRTAHAFPSEIHVELLEAGLIPDPYLGFNEHKIQWVGEREWLYRYTFDYEKIEGEERVSTEICFEGLDTFCDVYLNGDKILAADNMFRIYTIALDSASLKATENTLLLHFKSAKLIAKELEQKYGKVRAGSANLGDPSRVYVRKAQYDWRWDWGPEIMTCGPYRPISFTSYVTRLTEVHTEATVPADLSASFNLTFEISGNTAAAATVQYSLKEHTTKALLCDHVTEVADIIQTHSSGKATVVLSALPLRDVELWWPVGYGKQTLYDVDVTLRAKDGNILDSLTRRVGFRRVRLIQEPLAEPDKYGKGTTFLFEVNGVRMFMGGSNWIPADNLLTRITDERYRAWLTLLRDGNQNMVRLWGGGVYEPDVFYDICDELGILVWQDFQFACGVYPADPWFVESVKAEAEDTVKRLRHHPSLSIFCGNNEDYQQVLQWGDVEDLPARVLYENILPDIVSTLTRSSVAYHFGSPYGGQGWDTADPTVGDVHQWDVWAGKELPWQNYGIMGGRFISEFGIPAMPDIRTIDYWLDGNVKDRWPQSKAMAQHCRAGAFERRFAVVMNENFRFTNDLERYVYHQQIMQSEAVSLAYRMWRREWRGKGKEYCAGALVWQLNDCWPVTSWALADYFLRPKAVYYTVARELKPVTVGIFRTVQQNRSSDRPVQFYEFGAFQSVAATIDIWGTNSSLQGVVARLEINCFDLDSDWTHNETHFVSLKPNQSTELLSSSCPCPPQSETTEKNAPSVTASYSVVVSARLLDANSGELLARFTDWPQPFRHVEFPDPQISICIERSDILNSQVTVSVEKPVKGLLLAAEGTGEDVRWSDNALDIVPGDPQTVNVQALGERRVTFTHMTCDFL